MQQIAAQIDKIIDHHFPSLKKLQEPAASNKPAPGKWSNKEIIGHMIDSAQSNIRRFIIGQYEDNPHIVYQQDNWVRLSNYQEWDVQQLANLWYYLNKQVVAVLNNMDPQQAKRTVKTEALHSIEWLAEDYVKHLLHHLHQVLELEPVPYP